MANEIQVSEQQPIKQDYVPSVVIDIETAVNNLVMLDQIKKRVMREGTDYDTIPGTKVPTLLKPGAERLLTFYGLGHRVECVNAVEDWEKGFFYYRYKATIIKSYPDYEIVVAECEGSANSKESRYRDRWIAEWKLKDFDITDTTGFKFREKEGKYGLFKEYKVENPDPYSIVNTIQKMAIKRAFVGATLQATGTSGFFTQDMEDFTPTPEPPKKKPIQSKTTKQTSSQQPDDYAEYEELPPPEKDPRAEVIEQLKSKWVELGKDPKKLSAHLRQRYGKGLYDKKMKMADAEEFLQLLVQSQEQPQPQEQVEEPLASPAQVTKICTVAGKKGISDEDQKFYIKKMYGKISRADLSKDEAHAVIDIFEKSSKEKLEEIIDKYRVEEAIEFLPEEPVVEEPKKKAPNGAGDKKYLKLFINHNKGNTKAV